MVTVSLRPYHRGLTLEAPVEGWVDISSGNTGVTAAGNAVEP